MNFEPSEVFFVLPYGRDGNFHGVEDEADFPDRDKPLKMTQWKVVSRSFALNVDGRSGGS